MMAWLKATDTIYVLAGGSPWTQHKSVWNPSQPVFSCPPAEALGDPRMGFGKLWCDIPSVRTTLGNPTSAELPQPGVQMQYFEGGLIFAISGEHTIVLLNNGSWIQH
jgi:hypothetical protein